MAMLRLGRRVQTLCLLVLLPGYLQVVRLRGLAIQHMQLRMHLPALMAGRRERPKKRRFQQCWSEISTLLLIITKQKAGTMQKAKLFFEPW